MATDYSKAVSLAGGVISVALLEALQEKGVLSLDDCRNILNKAMNGLAPVTMTPEGYEASQIIADVMRTKFPHRR